MAKLIKLWNSAKFKFLKIEPREEEIDLGESHWRVRVARGRKKS